MNKKGITLVIIGCIFIIIAGLMVTYNYYENKKSGIESKKIYEIIQEKDIIEETNIITEEMKTINIDGNEYIGTISIQFRSSCYVWLGLCKNEKISL